MHEKEKRYMEEHGPGPSPCRDEDSATRPCVDPKPPQKAPKGMSACKFDKPPPPMPPKPECMRGVNPKLPPCKLSASCPPVVPRASLPVKKCCVPEPPEPPSLTFCQEKKIKEIEARGKPVCTLPPYEPPPPPDDRLALCIERVKYPTLTKKANNDDDKCKSHRQASGKSGHSEGPSHD